MNDKWFFVFLVLVRLGDQGVYSEFVGLWVISYSFVC